MDSGPEIPYLDLHTVQSVMKLGGKKKLDALIGSLNDLAELRMQDLKDAQTLSQAQSAAKGLKISASSLGLARLEDLCDQILSGQSWQAGSNLVAQTELALTKGRQALSAYRAGI
ncbi:MAG TPA: hypothetical protein VK914_01245 [bacterium]|nr:hypothetical protein [bacterium]